MEYDIKLFMQLRTLERRIEHIKKKLQKLGPMRPGSLSKQYNVCGMPKCRCKNPTNPQKHGPYYQLSYVHQGKSTTRFIRKPLRRSIEQQVVNYKLFKRLMEEWIHLSIEYSDQQLELAKRQSPL